MSMFCGRSKDLQKIEAKLCCDEEHRHDSSRKLLFVSGPGGVGKTRLTAKFAEEKKSFYQGGVYLFNAQSTSAFRQSLETNIVESEVCGTSLKSDLSSQYNFFVHQLQKQKENVLFLYDSCDKLEIIEKLLPREDEQIHVIVTTRQRDGHYFLDHSPHKVLHLDVLETDDAVQTLLSWKGYGQNNGGLDDECKEKSSAKVLVEQRRRSVVRNTVTCLLNEKRNCKQ
ncbi:uncharacterized protein LOC134180753 [Corticium candelabrum]|uniref:uncharacterized protein LOC134180753 n=1 Tax=Corticium candelabrum TaxID=121492 RepID=UPI002E272A96|nr:uncharacterized protein LOC134180753 [Corticium candelabrum]